MKLRVWDAVGLQVFAVAGCKGASLPGGDPDGDGWRNREDCERRATG